MKKKKFGIGFEFATPDFQRMVSTLDASQNSPDRIAKRKAELAQERKDFWKSYQFWLPATLLVIGLTLLLLRMQGVIEDHPMLWLWVIGVPALMFAVFYPRQR